MTILKIIVLPIIIRTNIVIDNIDNDDKDKQHQK